MSDDQITLPDDEPERTDPPAEGAEAGAAAQAPSEPQIPTCAECGNPLEEGQPYCLECGAPTPWAPKLRRGVGAAGILAIGLVALGIGAGALAYAIANEDEPTAGTSSVFTPTTGSLPSIPSIPTFDTTPSVDQTDTFSTLPTISTSTFPPPTFGTDTFPTGPDTNTGTTTTTPTTATGPTITTQPPVTTQTQPPPSTSTTPPIGGGADEWPDGVSGWTVILASTSSQSDATAFRDRVRASGRAAGLIESSLYSSLQPDLWVVYSGRYSDRTTALNQAASLRGTYAGAYAQRIEE